MLNTCLVKHGQCLQMQVLCTCILLNHGTPAAMTATAIQLHSYGSCGGSTLTIHLLTCPLMQMADHVCVLFRLQDRYASPRSGPMLEIKLNTFLSTYAACCMLDALHDFSSCRCAYLIDVHTSLQFNIHIMCLANAHTLLACFLLTQPEPYVSAPCMFLRGGTV